MVNFILHVFSHNGDDEEEDDKTLRAEGVGPVAEHLPSKCKTLRSNPRMPKNNNKKPPWGKGVESFARLLSFFQYVSSPL
jgi:hypothetical protein